MSAGAGQGGVSRRFKIALAAALAGAIAVTAMVLVHQTRSPDYGSLTAAERSDLVHKETPDGPFLVHPTLGFRLRHPGNRYLSAPETVQELRTTNGDPSTRFYAYADLKTGNLLVVTLSKRPGQSGDAFSDMVHNVWREFVQKTAVRIGERVPAKTVENDVDRANRTASLHAVFGTETHLRLRAVSHGPYVIMAIGIGMADDKLAPAVASLQAH